MGENSKFPDLKEIINISNKLFQDVKKSVSEIIEDYKQKRAASTTDQHETEGTGTSTSSVPPEHIEPAKEVPVDKNKK